MEVVTESILPMKRMTDGNAKETSESFQDEQTIPTIQETFLTPSSTDTNTPMQVILDIEKAPSIQDEGDTRALLFTQQIEQFRNKGYARIDETMAMVFSQETSSTASILDRIEYFRIAFDAFVEYIIAYPSSDTISFLHRTFSTILKILENIKIHPQDTKYHSIKKSNPAMQR